MIFLDKNVQIYRLEAVSGNKTRMTTLTTTLEVCIQPLGDSKAGMYGGSFGKMFKVFMDSGKDVKEGDQVRDYEGNIYRIIAGSREDRNDGFIADYMSIIVEKTN